MSFANNLKEARNKIGISQDDLARKLFISRQAISRYENGTAEPSIGMLNEICVVLNISIEVLIGSKKEVKEYKSFNFLSRQDRKLMWHDFAALNKWNAYYLPIICFMLNNLGFGLSAYFVIQRINNSFSMEMFILSLIASILFIIGAISLLVNNSINTSSRFNRWLRVEKSIIRTKNLIII